MSTAREDTTRLADLLRSEHHALAEFLIALATFDRDRRWVELGYPSLFEFLRRELKLSAGAAQYRKTAAALIQAYPAVEAALRSGDLCLSSVVEVAKVLTPENAPEVLPRFFGKSARDAAFVAASIRPVENPPAREFLIMPLRPSEDRLPEVGAVTAGVFRTSEMEGAPAVPVTAPLAPKPILVAPAPERPRIKALDAERARMNMTVSRRLLDKLAAARDALSHSHPGASEETILEVGLDLIIDRYRKRRGIGAKPRSGARAIDPAAALSPLRRAGGAIEGPGAGASSAEAAAHAASEPAADADADAAPTAAPAADAVADLVGNPAADADAGALADPAANAPPHAAPPKRNRHVPAHVWRGVWDRDGGRCVWPLGNGGVCGSTNQLELDHVDGYALGGVTTIDRCRLLCRFHQDIHARDLYGDARMDEFTNRKSPVCSEPIGVYGAPVCRRGEAPARGRVADPRPAYRPRFPRAASSAAASRFTFSCSISDRKSSTLLMRG